MKVVLVAGASGLVGKCLVRLLKNKGYSVHTLTTSAPTDITAKRFHWSPEKGYIDSKCFDGVSMVINLSGAGVFDHWWTESYKDKILRSRTESTLLLANTILKYSYPIEVFINASGISVYGNDTGDRWVDEESPTTQDFLAKVVQQWEGTLLEHSIQLRKVCFRLGIVLSTQGGALPKFATPVKLGVGAAFASGKQYISWIHIEDLAEMMIYALENEKVDGVYNAVAPNPLTNRQFVHVLAKQFKKKVWAPSIPSFLLNLMLGKERAATLIGGNRVANKRIIEDGFMFRYKTLDEALHDLFLYKK